MMPIDVYSKIFLFSDRDYYYEMLYEKNFTIFSGTILFDRTELKKDIYVNRIKIKQSKGIRPEVSEIVFFLIQIA